MPGITGLLGDDLVHAPLFPTAGSRRVDATCHFTFTGKETTEATVVIRSGTIAVERGLKGQSNLHVIAEAETWLGFLAKGRNLVWALIAREIRIKGNPRWLPDFSRCFPA